MKINYETYPILKKLEHGTLGKIPVRADDWISLASISPAISECFKNNSHKFNDITFVSSAFMDAVVASEKKLGEIYRSGVSDDNYKIEINGTFVEGNMVYFFSHIVENESNFEDSCIFAFDKKGILLFFYEKRPHSNDSIHWVSAFYSDSVAKLGVESVYMNAGYRIVVTHLFKQYAQVETKYIAPNSKILNGKTKHQNDTNLGVTYLTSKWFTNIVRSEGFVVRGHFRLQPKKVNGEWTKELIYIESFEKTGYTHNAQINA